MPTVTFYKFSKKSNSTAIPTEGTTLTVLFKEPTDLHNPTLKVSGVELGQYNYFKMYDSYYWVTAEIAFPNNWIEYTGTVDPLATCRDDILNTTVFVERSAAIGSVQIMDNYAPSMSNAEVLLDSAKDLYHFNKSGMYVLSILASLAGITNVGGMSACYALTAAQLNRISQKLNAPDFLEQLKQYFADPLSAIISCTWLPIDIGVATDIGTPSIAGYDLGVGSVPAIGGTGLVNGGVIFNSTLDKTVLSTSQYVSIELYLPYVGIVNLSPDDFLSDTEGNVGIQVEYVVDLVSGAIVYEISTEGRIVSTYTGSCGTSLPVGKTSSNAFGVTMGAVTAISSLVAKNPIGVMSGAATMIDSMRSSSQVNGGFTSRAGSYDIKCRCHIERKKIPEPITNKRNVIGLPTYKTVRLGTISGYVKCINASISSSQELSVIEQCNNYLNNGVFIE